MFNFFQAVINSTPMGRVYATTEKPYYVAGELIRGNIIVEGLMPLPANGIDVRVTGYEKTEWHDRSVRHEVIKPAFTDGQGQHHPAQTREIPQFKRQRAKKSFFDQTIRVYSIAGGMLPAGTYTYPFQYQLPDGIPGSFYERSRLDTRGGEEYIDNDGIPQAAFYDSDDEYDGQRSMGPNYYQRSGVLAMIVYKLKVTLDINNLFNAATGIQDPTAKIPLIVHPKLQVGLQPAMSESTQDVIVCCCINKGKCRVCARFDKLAYVNGETADVRCDIENDSTSNLKTRVILRRYLTLKSTKGQKAITEDVVQQQYDVVGEKSKSMNRAMPLQLAGDKVKPSTSGGFVTCNYEYLVECAVSMGTDIHLKMPVTIYAPQPPPIPGQQAAPSPMPVVVAPPPQQTMPIMPVQVMPAPVMPAPVPMPMMPQPPMAAGKLTGSGVFDEKGYLAFHPDVAKAGMNAFEHYKNHGKNENRPIVLTNGLRGTWDDAGYLGLHPDVAKAGMTGWNHWIQHGKNENRPIVVQLVGAQGKFDGNAYHQLHPDVRNAGVAGFEHFKTYGKNENRVIQLESGVRGHWDDAGYLLLHPDVKNAGMTGFDHWKQHGFGEGRAIAIIPSGAVGKFDNNLYHSTHPDVRAAGQDAWAHFLNHGKNENRKIALHNGVVGQWDDASYLSIHADVAKAGMGGWQHFSQYGKNENRPIAVKV